MFYSSSSKVYLSSDIPVALLYQWMALIDVSAVGSVETVFPFTLEIEIKAGSSLMRDLLSNRMYDNTNHSKCLSSPKTISCIAYCSS